MKHNSTIATLSSRVMSGIGGYFKVFFPGHFPMDKLANGNYPRVISDEFESVICPICGHGDWKIAGYNEIKCNGNCHSVFIDHGVLGLKPIHTPKLKK